MSRWEGRTILVTGGTNGLGLALVERLAGPGVRILVHGRNLERGELAVRRARDQGAEANFYGADLASLEEVNELAAAVDRDCAGLDLLINNAGIGFGRPGQRRQLSRDGYELRFAVNYLAPVSLTQKLLPKIIGRDQAQVINIASAGQEALDLNDPFLETRYRGSRAYMRSKLALVMWTFDLAQALRPHGVRVNAIHPASFMNTHMVREGWGIPLARVSTGVNAVLHLAELSPEQTAGYYEGRSRTRAHPQAYVAAVRSDLQTLTARLLASPALGGGAHTPGVF